MFVNRTKTPGVVLCIHAPWYNSNTAHHNEEEEVVLRTLMEDLLYEYKVDLMFSGHVHSYERMHPVFKQKLSKGATTYINIGDGGNREGPAETYINKPEWSAFREPVFGHGELNIVNASFAEWSWKRNLDSQASEPADSVLLIKNDGVIGGLTAVPK
jgi:hypothetical protein